MFKNIPYVFIFLEKKNPPSASLSPLLCLCFLLLSLCLPSYILNQLSLLPPLHLSFPFVLLVAKIV